MKLNLKERIVLLNLLPRRGDVTTIRVTRDLQDSLAPSEKEFEEFEIRQEGSQYFWNKKANEPKEIEIGTKAAEIIRESLRELDEKEEMTADHLSVYDKFMEVENAKN